MKIKPVLARLQNVIDSQQIIEQMVLLPEPAPSAHDCPQQTINLVVGYNSSPSSQTALDIALLIAHQTRLATQKQVTVHVVYVLEENCGTRLSNFYQSTDLISSSIGFSRLEVKAACAVQSATPVLTLPKTRTRLTTSYLTNSPQDSEGTSEITVTSIELLEQADQILWQARCLAEEWRGTFVAHLRFGCLSTELKEVVKSEAADLLLLGCSSKEDLLVQQLGDDFSCAVLGIPTQL